MKVHRNAKAKQMIHETYDALLRQWGTATQEMALSSPFGSTHIVAAGSPSSKPLILFHGVGDDSALMWLYNARALASKYRVYAVDTIGGPGKSIPGVQYGKGFDDADWIDTILEALSLDSASMMGTSHGAYLVQYYAAMRPGRVEKMICLAGSLPVGEQDPMKNMMKIFLPEALIPTRRNTQKLLRKLCGDDSEMFLGNATVMTHYQWLLKGFNNMAMRYHAIRPLTDAQIAEIRPRALYLNGNADPFQLLGGKEPLQKYDMNCRFFDGVGHGINHEISAQINEIILDFI